MPVRVRFAPSPTGALHIGSLRTALFNWLFARHYEGKFLLRVEDTDKIRSTAENKKLIFEILDWMGLNVDEPAVTQSERLERHREVAMDLVSKDKAYFCFCSPEELAAKKEAALKEGKTYKYDGTCRDRREPIDGVNPAVRLKMPTEGSTILNDMVQGTIEVQNSQLDDFIILRSDGTPTYMLSVVVDDHDMDISHVIRGDDHLTNTFKQMQLYKACEWDVPTFAHIPLIYGPDGAKLSKRHGAVSANEYKDMGYLPEALANYLLRLGWGHGDDEIISREQAIEWFDLDHVGKSPSRFDLQKLNNLNSHYIKNKDNDLLLESLRDFLILQYPDITEFHIDRIKKGLTSLKERAKSLIDLAIQAGVYVVGSPIIQDECSKYATPKHLDILRNKIVPLLENSEVLKEDELVDAVKSIANEEGVKLVEVAQAIRGALAGKLVSPSVFEVIAILGKDESISRINTFIKHFENA